MKHFMLDLETLDTERTAIVLSIGLVRFDETNILSTQGWNLFTKEQLEAGRTMSLDTIEWWMDYGDRYPKKNRVHPTVALTDFRLYFPDEADAKDASYTIWAKPSTFDVPMIEHLMGTYGIKVPWNRKHVRNVYTATHKVPKDVRDKIKAENATAHNAVADCVEQVRLLWAAQCL